jgi:hypothetical protein
MRALLNSRIANKETPALYALMLFSAARLSLICTARKKTFATTDWPAISRLYGQLPRLYPNPFVQLNYAHCALSCGPEKILGKNALPDKFPARKRLIPKRFIYRPLDLPGIIEMHGARIAVESIEDSGSAFTFIIPVKHTVEVE